MLQRLSCSEAPLPGETKKLKPSDGLGKASSRIMYIYIYIFITIKYYYYIYNYRTIVAELHIINYIYIYHYLTLRFQKDTRIIQDSFPVRYHRSDRYD